MAVKIICDGCGADTRTPPGSSGDGLARELKLRLGLATITMDLCGACHKRARSWLVEAFPEMARTREAWWQKMAPDESRTEGLRTGPE